MSHNEIGKVVEGQSLDGKILMSCAKCYSMAVYLAKVIVESCPECGSSWSKDFLRPIFEEAFASENHVICLHGT